MFAMLLRCYVCGMLYSVELISQVVLDDKSVNIKKRAGQCFFGLLCMLRDKLASTVESPENGIHYLDFTFHFLHELVIWDIYNCRWIGRGQRGRDADVVCQSRGGGETSRGGHEEGMELFVGVCVVVRSVIRYVSR